jgi:Proteasome subunit
MALEPLTSIGACRFVFESAVPVGRLVRDVADKNQVGAIFHLWPTRSVLCPLFTALRAPQIAMLHVTVMLHVPMQQHATADPPSTNTDVTSAVPLSRHPSSRLPAPHRAARPAQNVTQQMWTRPYGVGLLVAGADAAGPHLYQTCPSGQFWKFKAIAIGARSQAAKTYLERKLSDFPEADTDGLVQHALFALQVRAPCVCVRRT